MIQSQFQIEPKVTSSDGPALLGRAGTADGSGRSPDDFENLLINLELHGRLSSRDIEFLDGIAPDGFITFLIHGERYVHPEDLNLFPIEVIRTTLICSEDTHFTHRYHSDNGSGAGSSAIHTGRVTEIGGQPLIVGMVGPESLGRRSDIHNRFGSLVQRWRQAATRVKEPLSSVRRALSTKQAVAVINRTTGRVMALNEPAVSLLGADSRGLTAREFTNLQSRLAPLVPDRSIAIENIACQGFDFSIMVISESVRPSSESIAHPAQNMLKGMHNKLCCIASSARSLEEILARIPGETQSELVRIIADETTELDRQLKRLGMLLDSEPSAKSGGDAVVEVRRAAETVRRRRRGANIDLEVGSDIDPMVSASSAALFYLFESILEAHAADSCKAARIAVRIGARSASGGLVVIFRTVGACSPLATQCKREHAAYARLLAAKTAITCVSNVDTANLEPETTLTISRQR
jgi:hypothetical protein